MEQESDTQLVGRTYAAAYYAAGRRDPPARDAATKAWQERHPDVPYKEADLTVARLICDAVNAGLVWGDTQW